MNRLSRGTEEESFEDCVVGKIDAYYDWSVTDLAQYIPYRISKETEKP